MHRSTLHFRVQVSLMAQSTGIEQAEKILQVIQGFAWKASNVTENHRVHSSHTCNDVITGLEIKTNHHQKHINAQTNK